MPIEELRIDVTNIGIEDAIKTVIEDDDDTVLALIGDVRRHDQRAEYLEDTFAVEAVDLLADGRISVTFGYEWHAHYGCQDLCAGGRETEMVVASFEARQLVFRIDRPEERSTADEF